MKSSSLRRMSFASFTRSMGSPSRQICSSPRLLASSKAVSGPTPSTQSTERASFQLILAKPAGGGVHLPSLSSRIADLRPSFSMGIGSTRSFSADLAHMPDIKDPEIKRAFKDLMASSWDELPSTVVHDAKHALSKSTDDKSGQEVLANVFRAAEAVEEFTGVLTSLKMEIDDSIGLSGENVKPIPEECTKALQIVFQRYATYLDSFGPEEIYLKKKVETELGTMMIHLKMRCSGLGSEWGKVTVLGTSGISGSYVEQRA